MHLLEAFSRKFLIFPFLFLWCISPSLGQPSNDNYANAIDVSGFINGCSGDAAYTTVGATGDMNAGSCWNISPTHNVWFKFVATTANIKVTIDRGGSKGTIQNVNAAIWQSGGTVQVACKRYINSTDDIIVEAVGTLTPGNTYYISVDNAGATQGTFTLCLEDNNISYDYYEGALDVSGFINGSSPDAAFSTYGMTPDKNPGSCWNTSPNNNVWFKFKATTTNMRIAIQTGGTKGTIRRINAALWQSDGTTQLACKRYINDWDSVVLEVVGALTVGNYYYITVDNNYAAYEGSFTLTLADNSISYDFYEGALDVSSYINGSSPDEAFTTYGMTADKNPGTCWNTSPNNNVWFRFKATTANMKIAIQTGGTKGTIRRINAALWQSDGTTQLECKRYINDWDSVVLEVVGVLTPGSYYYISVDNNYSPYEGSFTMTLNDHAVSYDFYEGAIDISSLINNCSANQAYTTYGMTADKNPGTCWNTSPANNVWFKFKATTANMRISILTGGSYGTIRRINAALWQSDGTTQLACKRYTNDWDSVVVEVVGALTVGNYYYLSVDNNYAPYEGTFTLCLNDHAVSYDFYEGALDISSLINGCSANQAYTTYNMSADKNPGTCWNTSPNNNVWFKFKATTANMKISILTGGSYGTIRRINAALWQADGTTQIACKRYTNDWDSVVVEVVGALTVGNYYYLSVDNNYAPYEGTFTLCLNDHAVSYDFYEGALDISSLINGCSANQAYTTYNMTPDKNPGTCWNTSPNNNVWFKFKATTANMKISILTGGSYGTIRRINAALWQSDGTTQIACKRYTNDWDSVVVEVVGALTVGNYYYLSVDNNYAPYEGTFTLCLNDHAVSYDFYEGALDVSSLINGCSANKAYTTYNMSADKNPGSCWNTSPNNNVWFKFKATTPNIRISVLTGGSYGTIRRINAALWQSDGTTQIACKRYINDWDSVVVEVVGALTVGNYYYISVDNNYQPYEGTFTLCLKDNAVSYDFYEGALLLSDIHNWCSANAAYTTYGMTADKNPASCWNTSPSNNVWFKFVATTKFITINVETSGAYGTIRRINAALWQSDGTTEVSCNRYTNDYDNVAVGYTNLTPGNTYYISVDNNYAPYEGTFTLCVTDQPDYDFYEGAQELTNLDNWCSANAAYTTVGATADKNAASCWNTSPNYNRWFKFTAISPNATITAETGTTLGTIRRINMALWASDGTTEIACKRYVNDWDYVTLTPSTLVPGNVYYISVDNNYYGYRGTFTLCINNIDEVYYSLKSGAWNNPANWSKTGYGGTPATQYPSSGDVVNIQGHTMTLSTSLDIAELNINADSSSTGLIIDNSALTVYGKLSMTNTGKNYDESLVVQNNGSLTVKDNATFTRNGGANVFSVTEGSGCTINLNKNMQWISTGGTVNNNLLTLNNNASLVIGNDLTMNYSGGMEILITLNTTSQMNVTRDISYVATGDNQEMIQLNNSTQLSLGRNFVRGTPAYGILQCNNSSTVNYNGTSYLQNMAQSAGSGTGDTFTYQNVTIDNTRITYPQVTLSGAATINGTLNMTQGILYTTSSNLISLGSGSSINSGSSGSFIDGPVKKFGNTAVVFPTGDGAIWAPVGLSGLTGDAATAFTAEYHHSSYSDVTNFKNPDPNGNLHNVSTLEYWDLSNSGTPSNANVTLYWENQNRSQITDFTDLRIAHYTGTQWENLGQSSITSSDPGSITVNGVTSFSPFTFGSMSSTVNPLPVRFLSFNADAYKDSVKLHWSTSDEVNNQKFIVERAVNTVASFEELGETAGSGNVPGVHYYNFTDRSPVAGNLYYRLNQVDFNGANHYSSVILVAYHFEPDIFTSYPNPVPAGGVLNLILRQSNTKGHVYIKLVSLDGTRIYDQDLTVENSSFNIHIPENLKSGMYILMLRTPTFSAVHKIIIW